MEESPAWDAPETQRAYRAFRLGGLRWFAGGLGSVLLAIGLSVYAVTVLKRPGLGVFIVASVLLGLIGLIVGSGALLRARRFRLALQRAPWRPTELRVAGTHLRLVFAEDEAQTGAADVHLDVRLMTTSRWRVREVVGYRDGEVLVCPMGAGGFVLTANGLDNLFGLLPLKQRVGLLRP